MDRRLEPVYPPFNFVEAEGIMKALLGKWYTKNINRCIITWNILGKYTIYQGFHIVNNMYIFGREQKEHCSCLAYIYTPEIYTSLL